MPETLNGGSVRILWDVSDSATVTITDTTGAPVAFTVSGQPVTFPYALSGSTTFRTEQSGRYVVSVLYRGVEISNTPDGTRLVSLTNGGNLVFAPTPDVSESQFFADLITAESVTTGQETFSRRLINSTGITSGASGRASLSYFTARKSETVTQFRMMSGTTAAVGTTLARVGLYTVAANGTLTLVASSANDTTLFDGTFGTETIPLSAPYTVLAGQRYALCVLVLATTMPTLVGSSIAFGGEATVPPRLGGTLSGQTDLPASITDASLSATNADRLPYAVLLP